MARRLAARHRRSGEPPEDLEQVAYLGLLKTIDRYELGRGSFLGYAVTTIRGELKHQLHDARMDRPRDSPRAGALPAGQCREAIEPAFRRLPGREQQILRMRFEEDLTQSEIAARCGVSQMQVSRVLRRSLNELLETVGGFEAGAPR